MKVICWISWDRMCQTKNSGGRVVKNLDMFNIVLEAKRRWRFLVDKEIIWYKLLNYSICFFRHAILNINVLEYKVA